MAILPVIAAGKAIVSGPHVLVADDNPLSLLFLADALAACGIDHATAADGALALECARREAFDLLLLDARMPKFKGTEVLARLRAQAGPSRHAIALATTADDTSATRSALLAAGFAEVLIKPISVDALRAAVGQFVPVGERGDMQERSIETLDDPRALAAAGGDAAIVHALRGLLARELDALPAELAVIAAKRTAPELRDRLHRLDASAGFCGVPALLEAATTLRTALDAPAWPDRAITGFLATCARIRRLLPEP